jgi:hemoglobin-like flavoprotein
MIDAAQIQIVTSTFELVVPAHQSVAELFYYRLLELDPELKALFKQDLKELGRKLMLTIAIAVNGLNKIEQVTPMLVALGSRHARYGIKPHHYETAGEALLWSLEKWLGPAFTDEARRAWVAFYRFLVNTMQGSLASVSPGEIR